MRVIGTAGHVDHGKSTLVEVLTGIHPDRLKEEREREMTIDLGFAWLTLPDGEEVGIVDVPGHRDFIENMLAGVGGIDAALFVIAADEGVMPQTREHLSILDILHIQNGVIALTKIDLVEDLDWLDLVEDDVKNILAGTSLSDAPVIRFSARSKEGLPELLDALRDCLASAPPRSDYGKPRLPVDRVFSMPGFGTVVTGTLSDGVLKVGEDVDILPSGIKGRIRGLQTHRKKEGISSPGSRTAVNISGVTVDQVQRGDVIIYPGDYKPTRRLDVHFRLLPDANQPLKHNDEVKLYIGSAETLARVRVLGSEIVSPGEEGWLQLEPIRMVVAVRGDRFILRRPSPGETLGGGIVVDPFPKSRHRRFLLETTARLETLAQGSPSEVLLQALTSFGIIQMKELFERSGLEGEITLEAVGELSRQGDLVVLPPASADQLSLTSDTLVVSRPNLDQIISRTVQIVENFHKNFPLKRGMLKEELKSRLSFSTRVFNAIILAIVNRNELLESGPLIMQPKHTIRFSPQQELSVNKLLQQFASSPFTPPSVKDCKSEVGDDVYNAMVEQEKLVQVSPEVVFDQAIYRKMVEEVRQLLKKNGSVTAAQVRDLFNTSRKYVLALLEHLDTIGITVREGDIRRLVK